MEAYIKRLVGTHAGITEIWLIGSRADGTASDNSDWDYLTFIDDPKTLNSLSMDTSCNDKVVVLLVVADGDNFIKPWPDADRTKKGSLTSWNWKRTSADTATYRATKARDGELDSDNFYANIYEGQARLIYKRQIKSS